MFYTRLIYNIGEIGEIGDAKNATIKNTQKLKVSYAAV